jgi:hypothetical protein
MKDKKKIKGSATASNSSSKDYNRYREHSPGTVSGYMWNQYNELKVWRDRYGAETAAPTEEVANTVSFNSSKLIFNTSTSSHMPLA